jgi:ketosteroid isomerase-like protein
VFFAQSNWTCSIAEFKGTHKGPMVGLDGKTIEPTNRKFKVDFCTVAHWKDGKIVEEELFYDLVGMTKQLGLM